jgi:flagellar motility protein MotE (MotC chaperone)
MKSGYDQFFKTAQDVKRGTPPPSVAKGKAQFKTRSTDAQTAKKQEQQLRQSLKMKRKKAPFPWKATAALAASLVLAGFYLAAPQAVENFVDRIQIRAMGAADAAENQAPAKKAGAEGKASSAKEAAQGKEKTETAQGAGEHPIEAVDASHFEKLKERKEALDLREKELGELEEELQKQKVELDKRITQLEDMRNQIAQILKDRVEIDQEKVNKLVDLYSNMKPKQAADVIASINEDLAVEVLAKMKKKSAAEIMNLLPSDKARVLSEKYTGYRRNHASDQPKS